MSPAEADLEFVMELINLDVVTQDVGKEVGNSVGRRPMSIPY